VVKGLVGGYPNPPPLSHTGPMVYTPAPAHVAVTFDEEDGCAARMLRGGSQRSLGGGGERPPGLGERSWSNRPCPAPGHAVKAKAQQPRSRSFGRLDNAGLTLLDFLGDSSDALLRWVGGAAALRALSAILSPPWDRRCRCWWSRCGLALVCVCACVRVCACVCAWLQAAQAGGGGPPRIRQATGEGGG
jgi:hypothetical protein